MMSNSNKLLISSVGKRASKEEINAFPMPYGRMQTLREIIRIRCSLAPIGCPTEERMRLNERVF